MTEDPTSRKPRRFFGLSLAPVSFGSPASGARPRGDVTTQLVLGLAIAVFGVLLTLDRLDILNAGDYLRFWPVVLIAIGVSQFAQARTPALAFGGAIWIVIGSIILLDKLHLIRMDVWNLWPLGLVLLGAYIVWQAFYKGSSAEASVNAGSTVSAIAVLSGIGRKSNSREFQGGELTAFMGGCELDLREATPANGEAVIDAFAMMGGIEIKVPESWSVVSKVIPLMGGFEDATTQPPGGAGPRLIVRGFAVMGGIGVKN